VAGKAAWQKAGESEFTSLLHHYNPGWWRWAEATETATAMAMEITVILALAGGLVGWLVGRVGWLVVVGS
jgi:hypothetical protein